VINATKPPPRRNRRDNYDEVQTRPLDDASPCTASSPTRSAVITKREDPPDHLAVIKWRGDAPPVTPVVDPASTGWFEVPVPDPSTTRWDSDRVRVVLLAPTP
jgi:hypothetical protein